MIEFGAHERPGAAGEVGPGLVGGFIDGDGGDGAGGVVRAGGDDVDLGEACGVGELRQEAADAGAGGDGGLKEVCGQVEGGEEVGVPGAGAAVDHLGGGGDGGFVDHLAAEEVVEEVGDVEQAVGVLEGGWFCVVLGDELVEGVEGEELDAGGVVDGVAAEAVDGFLEGAGVAWVAVGEGEAQELA